MSIEFEATMPAVPVHPLDTVSDVIASSQREALYSPSEVCPGAWIGEYVVHRQLGYGGFGTVWYAVHATTGHDVAIKVMHGNRASCPEFVARFHREARIIGMLDHDNVVQLEELGALPDGTPYLVMEYLVGISLADYLRQQGPLAPRDTLSIMEQLSAALSAAHAHDIIHRDVKASNIMLCQRPDDSHRVVLLDFGIAKPLRAHETPITAPLAAIGSPSVMAPEQISGQSVDTRTDIYGLGVLAYQLLTGETPFRGNVSVILCSHIDDSRPEPSRIDESLRAFDPVIARAMARDPAERYARVEDFLAAWRTALMAHHGFGQQSEVAALRKEGVLGIYVQADIDLASDDAPVLSAAQEDAAMDDIDEVMTRADEFLTQRGFAIAYDHGNMALFVLTDSAIADQLGSQRSFGAALVDNLRAHLARRPDSHPGVTVEIGVDIGDVELCEQEIVGGSLVDDMCAIACAN